MTNERIADLLDGLELFKDFSYAELKALSPYLTHHALKQNEVVFNEGDPGNYMLILVAGTLAVYKGGEIGQHMLSYEGRGRVVGEMALIDQERRSATCLASSDCELMTLSADGLARLVVDHPSLAYRFMFALARLLSRRLRRTSGMLVEYLTD
ncbi:MAG: cyclic nucleotide-binding domain-containing protein [Pseudomonadota bacterium]